MLVAAFMAPDAQFPAAFSQDMLPYLLSKQRSDHSLFFKFRCLVFDFASIHMANPSTCLRKGLRMECRSCLSICQATMLKFCLTTIRGTLFGTKAPTGLQTDGNLGSLQYQTRNMTKLQQLDHSIGNPSAKSLAGQVLLGLGVMYQVTPYSLQTILLRMKNSAENPCSFPKTQVCTSFT